MSKRFTIFSAACLAVYALSAPVFAADTASGPTMIEGVSNGVTSKYDKNCLDIAHKNAKDDIKGNSSDHSGFKCYKDGKVIDCSSIREDSQTQKAEDEWKELEKKCNVAATCKYGGKLTADEECACYEPPKCEATCERGTGTPRGDGTQACNCDYTFTFTVGYTRTDRNSSWDRTTTLTFGTTNGQTASGTYPGTINVTYTYKRTVPSSNWGGNTTTSRYTNVSIGGLTSDKEIVMTINGRTVTFPGVNFSDVFGLRDKVGQVVTGSFYIK